MLSHFVFVDLIDFETLVEPLRVDIYFIQSFSGTLLLLMRNGRLSHLSLLNVFLQYHLNNNYNNTRSVLKRK